MHTSCDLRSCDKYVGFFDRQKHTHTVTYASNQRNGWRGTKIKTCMRELPLISPFLLISELTSGLSRIGLMTKGIHTSKKVMSSGGSLVGAVLPGRRSLF